MAIVLGNKKSQDVGSWQEFFVPNYSERINKARERSLQQPEICLERARTEMKVYEQYKDEPRIIQRARFLEEYLKEKAIFILEDELIVGNINSKVRGLTISGTVGRFSNIMPKQRLDDPMMIFDTRYKGMIHNYNEAVVHPEERKALDEVILPYFKGKTFVDYNFQTVGEELKEKAYQVTSSCPHIPNSAGVSMWRDIGHQMPNNEKVLHIGLNGIRKEVEWYMAQLDQPK